jgi:methylmalonic aciduria homocystinuria type C protein
VAEPEWKQIVHAVQGGCARGGLDIVHAFATGAYNANVPAEWRVHDFGRDDRLGILLGNTRALWPHFISALHRDAALAQAEHPFEEYVRAQITRAIAGATERPSHVTWAHETEPRALPIQRLAERVGLASLGPSHLSVHPVHGPWLSLHAVAVFDIEGPSERVAPLRSPCAGCSQPCMPALEAALQTAGTDPNGDDIARHARAWIAVRDACPVGRDARYSEQQLAYHYTKDRSLLG